MTQMKQYSESIESMRLVAGFIRRAGAAKKLLITNCIVVFPNFDVEPFSMHYHIKAWTFYVLKATC